MTTRRGFLGAILAAATAPVFVRAEILMPVRKIIVPPQGFLDHGPYVWGWNNRSFDEIRAELNRLRREYPQRTPYLMFEFGRNDPR